MKPNTDKHTPSFSEKVDSMSIRSKLKLLFIVLFSAAFGNAIFTFQMEKYGNKKLTWVMHTHDVIHHTEAFLSAIKDVQAGQRGFVLTRNAYYLEPYHSGLNNIIEHLNQIKELTANNPEQQARLRQIERAIAQRLTEINKTIDLAQAGGSSITHAVEIIQQNKGKAHMDEIKKHSSDFINHERIQLERRSGDYRAYKTRITTLLIAEFLFLVFFGILAIIVLNKNFFTPLKLLLSSTQRMEQGEKLNIEDMLPKHEMGYLLSRFYLMNEKVHARTSELSYRAHHDSLTGLKNRESISKEIWDALSNPKGANSKTAVLFIDLNKFKPLNDTLGHDAGDKILKETAKRLKKSVRSYDEVFRIGGDEFLVLVTNLSDVSQAGVIANKILEQFKPPMLIDSKPIDLSLSMGIAVAPDHTICSEEIITFADIAMYAAKYDKKEAYKLFDKSMLKQFKKKDAPATSA